MNNEGRFQKDFILYNPDRYNSVVVTGSWCGWSEQGHKLTKIPGLYWIATVNLPYNTKVSYKYIIDGVWQTNPDDETETDSAGNTNNVFSVPKAEDLPGPLVGATSSTKQEPILATSTSARSGISSMAVGAPGASSTSTQSTTTSDRNTEAPSGHSVADSGVAAAAAKAATKAGLGHDEHEKSTATSAGPASSSSGLNHVPTGGSAAESGVAAQAAKEAAGQGLGQSSNADVAAAGPASSSSGLTHLATGGAAAESGVASQAAREAASQGLGQSGPHGHNETQGVTGVEKSGPNVVTAVSGGAPAVSGDIATPNVGSSSTSTSTSAHKAPLPASTGDAPLAPGSLPPSEGKGLFGVLGGLGAAAVGAATAAATTLAHRVQEGDSVAAAAEQARVAALPSSASTGTGAHTGKEALSPIASGDTTARITKDFASVDLDHTKQEVVHAVERLGATITGGFAGFGSAVQSDVNHVTSKTGGLSAATPTGSAANTPGVSSSSALSDSVVPVPVGMMNNIAGAAGSSATVHDSNSTSRAAPSASGVNVPGLDVRSSHSGSSASKPVSVPGLSINGSSPSSSGAHGPAAAASGINVPGLDVKSTNSGSSASKPVSVPGLSINGSSPSSSGARGATAAASGVNVPGLNVNSTGATSSGAAKPASVPGVSINGSSPSSGASAAASGPSSSSKPSTAVVAASPAPAPVATPASTSSTPAASAGLAANLKKEAETKSSAPGSSSTAAAPAAAKTETPKSTVSKKDASALGMGTPQQPPVTPKKSRTQEASSASTPATDGYKTAPSTPASQAGTPVDRKRKSSIFHKIKSALSPNK